MALSRNEEMALRWFGGEIEMHGAWPYAALGTWYDIPFTACSCWNPLCSRRNFGPLSQDCAEEEGWVSPPNPVPSRPCRRQPLPTTPLLCQRPTWYPILQRLQILPGLHIHPGPTQAPPCLLFSPCLLLKEPPLHHLSVRKANSKGLSQYEFLLFLFM